MVSVSQESICSLGGCFQLRVSLEAAIECQLRLQNPASNITDMAVEAKAQVLAVCWLEESVLCHVDLSMGLLTAWELASARETEREREKRKPEQRSVFL